MTSTPRHRSADGCSVTLSGYPDGGVNGTASARAGETGSRALPCTYDREIEASKMV